MRRYTQRRDARDSQRHACRSHQDGDVGSASSRRTRATLPTPTVTVGYASEVERRSCSPRRSKRVRCTQAGPSFEGPKGQIVLWMLADSDNGRDDPLPKERGGTPVARGKEQERTVRSLQDNRARKRFKVRENRSSIEGLLGKATAATEPRTIKFFSKWKRREGEVWQRWKETQKLEHLVGLSRLNETPSWKHGNVVCTAE